MTLIKAIILAGGSGSRLWPLSRASHPKQFLTLDGKHTMLQTTMKRLSALNVETSIIICNEDHRFFVAEQLREIDKIGSILLEPIARNTAPATAIAAMMSKDDDLLLVVSSDHVIRDNEDFIESVKKAVPLAVSGKLITFGITAETPETGYGYIKRGKRINEGYSVAKFIEKPPLKSAKNFVLSGDYYWNSGMFLFRADKYLAELSKFSPDVFNSCKSALTEIKQDLDFIRINTEKFSACPSISIDYAVMEKTKDAAVVPMNARWSDIGSWTSLWNISEKDNNGNCTFGDVILSDTKNSMIRSDGKLIATIGINDLIIVSSKDALFVADKKKVDDIKIIYEKIKSESRSEWKDHKEVFRPWGKFEVIDSGEGYQAKRISVNPGAKLSVQLHKQRSEHWVVVSGKAKVTKGKKTFFLNKNESTYIPIGTIHALENTEENILEIIEVQSGSYLGEDDIVRLSDLYGR